MSIITASPEIDISQLEGAPDDEWLRKFNESYNETGRQVVSAINRRMPFTDCETSTIRPFDLVHAQSVTIKNPLSVPIKAVYPVACVGLSVDSTGKPTRGVYDLAMPQIEWHNSTKGDGSIVVTANYSQEWASSGFVGELNESIIESGSAVSLTSGAVANLTTITLQPGDWALSANMAFNGTATSLTIIRCITSSVSASSAGSVPDSAIQNNGSFAIGQASLAMATRYVTVATGSTQQLWLNARATFSGGTCSAFGRISAARTTPYASGKLGRVGLLFLGDG